MGVRGVDDGRYPRDVLGGVVADHTTVPQPVDTRLQRGDKVVRVPAAVLFRDIVQHHVDVGDVVWHSSFAGAQLDDLPEHADLFVPGDRTTPRVGDLVRVQRLTGSDGEYERGPFSHGHGPTVG